MGNQKQSIETVTQCKGQKQHNTKRQTMGHKTPHVQLQNTTRTTTNTTRTTTKHHTYNNKTPHVQLQKREERLVHI